MNPADGSLPGAASSMGRGKELSPKLDDPRVTQVLEEYLAGLEAGQAPDRQQLQARYPDVAEALAECLAGLDFVQAATPELEEPDSDRLNTATAHAAVVAPEGPLGDFRLVREIGRGGMGVVYEAVQISLGRRVALKVLPFAAALDAKQLQRFKNEAQAAAHLHHTNIVPVFAVGCERGVHYYAMQYIEGQTVAALIRALRQRAGLEAPDPASLPVPAVALAGELTSGQWLPIKSSGGEVVQWCAGTDPTGPYRPATSPPHYLTTSLPLGATPALAVQSTERSTTRPAFFRTVAYLGMQIAEALEHAHQLGIIHRDVKPANLLVDTRGRVWITDFGLAHCQSQPGLTMTGDLVGTLRYMSPEQALAMRVLVDHRTDIYSLGATLYELLTLEHAFGGRDRQELLRQIASEEPQPLRRLNKAVPVELETIILKAIEKNLAERYTTAQELADDLERYLKDESIRARRPTLLQKARKWARRHRGTVATGTVSAIVFLLLAVAGLAVSNVLISREQGHKEEALAAARRNYDEAQRQRRRTEDLLERQYVANSVRLMDEGDPYGALPWIIECLRLAEGDPLREEMHRLRFAAALGQCPKMLKAWFHDGPVSHAEFSTDGARVLTASYDCTARVWDVTTGRPITPPLVHADAVPHASFSPDGRWVVTASADGTARVWDAATGQAVGRPLKHSHGLWHALFSPDGRFVVTASANGTARVWNSATGEPVTSALQHKAAVRYATFSRDGRRVVTASDDGTAGLWDASSGKLLTPPLRHGPPIWHASFSPDGRYVATGGEGGTARVWEVATGKPATAPLSHDNVVAWVSFSPDGRYLVTSGHDATARLWEVSTGKLLTAPLRHGGPVRRAAFSPDGQRVITAGDDRNVRIWNAATGVPILPVMKHNGPVLDASFSSDGRFVLSASQDETARLWDPSATESGSLRLKHQRLVRHVSFSPDGRSIATASFDHTGRVWDAMTGRAITPPLRHRAEVMSAWFSPDGGRVVTAGRDRTAQVWDAVSGIPITPPLRHGDVVEWAIFSPDGRQVATASRDQTARLWDAITGAQIGPPLHHLSWVFCVAFSPDGRRVVTATRSGASQIWDAITGAPLARLPNHTSWVTAASFSPNGHHVITASNDGTAWVSEEASGNAVLPPLKHKSIVRHASFSPDGRYVLTAGADQTAQVWDAVTGNPVGVPLKHSGDVVHASFSRDGRRVVTASSTDGSARIWDASTGEPIGAALPHGDSVWCASFSPDGRRVVTACGDRTARVWELPLEDRPLANLVGIAQVLSDMEIRAPGKFVPLETTKFRSDWAALWSKYPRDFPSSPPEQMAAWQWKPAYRRGLAYALSEKWDKAVVEFTEALDLTPQDPRPWVERSYALLALKEQEKAAADLRKAIEFPTEDGRCLRLRAWLCHALGHWAQAVADSSKLLQVAPCDPAVWTLRGHALVALGRCEEGAADYVKAFQLDSEDGLVWFHVACSHLDAAETNSYHELCKRMLEKFGETKDPCIALCVARTWALAPNAVGDTSELVRLAEFAVSRFPKNMSYPNVLATAHYRARQFNQAARWAHTALEAEQTFDGEGAPSWLVLAMVHQQLGQRQEARQWLDKAERWLNKGAIGSTGFQKFATGFNSKWTRREVQILYQEAQALVKGAPTDSGRR